MLKNYIYPFTKCIFQEISFVEKKNNRKTYKLKKLNENN